MSFAATESATVQSAGNAITPEDLTSQGVTADDDVARYALMLGDDSLILAQRLGHWISRAPELEEDIALGNIALDLLGHARFFLTYAGTAWGKTEDALAYFRDEEEFRSCRLVNSTDRTLAAIAAKALKEVEYHQDHATQWSLRLGLGTEESKRRIQEGFDVVWPYIEELFLDVDPVPELGNRAVAPSSLKEDTLARVTAALQDAGLEVPTVAPVYGADRTGQFSEQRGFILAEMQVLARQYPGATW